MNEPLNDGTEQKARELARQITVAHDLDPEIQEELYGHIEDELLAYKSGDIPITEDDQYLLAQYRSGRPHATPRGTCLTPQAAGMSWFRQMLLLAVATTCALILARLFIDAYRWFVPLRDIEAGLLRSQAHAGGYLLWIFAAPGILLLILRHWGLELRRVARPWFLRLPAVYIAGGALLLIFVGDAIPRLLFPLDVLGFIHMGPPERVGATHPYVLLAPLCLIWMAWTYRFSGRLFPCMMAGVSWAVYYILGHATTASIAVLTENTNPRLYAPHWLGEIALRQLWPDHLPPQVAPYFAVVALCAFAMCIATRNWHGIWRAIQVLWHPSCRKPVLRATHGERNDRPSLSDEETLVLVQKHLGDTEELRSQFQCVHLGIDRTSPIRPILTLVIATLVLCCIADIAGSAVRLAAAAAVTSELVQAGRGLQVVVGLFELPLVCMGLVCLLVHWSRTLHGRSARWFQRWSIRRMVSVAVVLFASQLVFPSAVISPVNGLGGVYHVQIMEGYVIPVLLVGWLWWAGGAQGGPWRIAAVGASLVLVLTVFLVQPLKLIVLMPRSWVVNEEVYWVYLGGERLGRLDLEWYFAPVWDAKFFGIMNFYLICVFAALLLVGVAQLGRQAPHAPAPFPAAGNSPPRTR